MEEEANHCDRLLLCSAYVVLPLTWWENCSFHSFFDTNWKISEKEEPPWWVRLIKYQRGGKQGSCVDVFRLIFSPWTEKCDFCSQDLCRVNGGEGHLPSGKCQNCVFDRCKPDVNDVIWEGQEVSRTEEWCQIKLMCWHRPRRWCVVTKIVMNCAPNTLVRKSRAETPVMDKRRAETHTSDGQEKSRNTSDGILPRNDCVFPIKGNERNM